MQDLTTGGMANPAQPVCWGLISPAYQAVNGCEPGDKVIEGARLIKEARFFRDDELRNSCDGRRQHDFSAGHRLHQHQRDAFALAGQHDNVGTSVQRVHLLAGDVPEQRDVLLEAASPDQRFQPAPFRSFAGNQALNADAAIAQTSARAHQKSVVLHHVQAPCGHEGEAGARGAIRVCLRAHIHAQPRDDHLLRLDPKVFENVATVVLRDGDAETAVLQFCVEICGMQQQVGPMQGDAEVYPQQAGRHHRDPRAEISVVHVDVIHASFQEQSRITSAQTDVRQSFRPSPWRLFALSNHSSDKRNNSSPSAEKKPGCLENDKDANRLQTDKSRIERLSGFAGRDGRSPHAPRNHLNAPHSECGDFLDHVGFNRGRILIGEIGDFWHADLRRGRDDSGNFYAGALIYGLAG